MSKALLLAILLVLPALPARAQDPVPPTAGTPNLEVHYGAILDTLLATRELDRTRTQLSTLWTVVALNMIGADVLGSFIPGTQQEIIDFSGGEENVKNAMLAGAVVYNIPISMIFLSRYLPYRANRWTNVGAAALAALTIVGAGSTDPHYLFMASAEILTLSAITWKSLAWTDPGEKPSRHDLGLHMKAKPGLVGLRYSYSF